MESDANGYFVVVNSFRRAAYRPRAGALLGFNGRRVVDTASDSEADFAGYRDEAWIGA
jgi:hypothetical protein